MIIKLKRKEVWYLIKPKIILTYFPQEDKAEKLRVEAISLITFRNEFDIILI